MPFPSSIPSYQGFTSTDTLQHDNHAAQHNQEQADIVALSGKVGTGASTPTQNTVLRGNGTGTTTYDQVHLATDVSGILATTNGGTGSATITGSGIPVFQTSPTINSPSITNPTITYNNNSIPAAAIANNSINSTQLASSGLSSTSPTFTLNSNPVWQYLGYAQTTSTFTLSSSETTPTQVTGLTATVTIPAGVTKVRITGYTAALTGSGVCLLSIWDGVVNSGTQVEQFNQSASNNGAIVIALLSPSAGSRTYNIGVSNSGSNVTIVGAGATQPAFILVECC